MPLRTSKSWRVEYFTLHKPRTLGRIMGKYAGREIREVVIDDTGIRYKYVGIAPRCLDGSIDIDALDPGEFIVSPGLIYRLDSEPIPWWRRLI